MLGLDKLLRSTTPVLTSRHKVAAAPFWKTLIRAELAAERMSLSCASSLASSRLISEVVREALYAASAAKPGTDFILFCVFLLVLSPLFSAESKPAAAPAPTAAIGNLGLDSLEARLVFTHTTLRR